MPAITKDEAIKMLRNAIDCYVSVDSNARFRGLIAAFNATEHITDTAATQAAAWPASVPVITEQVVDDLAMLVKRLVRQLEKANPGTDLAPQALDYLKRKGLQGSPLREAAPADLSAVEVPPLPEPSRIQMEFDGRLSIPCLAYTADQMTNFYRDGYAAGRASMKGNK